MKIQEKDFYYGVALTQIAEYPTFTYVNKVTDKDGLYELNDYKRILIKYSTSSGPEWRFSFREDDVETSSDHEFFFILVCGHCTVCLLQQHEIAELLDTSSKASQWISVSYPDGGQIRVRGSRGNLSHMVPHNLFPQALVGPVKKEQEPFAWPPLSRLNFYRGLPNLILSSEDRMLDLSDRITSKVTPRKGAIVYFGLSTISDDWGVWSEKNLWTIEKAIKYDLEFDGFKVEMERVTDEVCPYTKKKNKPCTGEFVWKLNISVDYGKA